MRSGGTNRTLAVIKDELDVALKPETTNIIAIGGLLAEARRHLRHGEWYPWLEQNFSLSRQSADRYIGIYRLSLKTPNLGDLKIRRSVLYAMFLLPPKRRLSPKAIETIMEEARIKWVGLTRAYQIEREIKLAEEAAYRREIEAIESGEKPERKVQDVVPPWESLPEPLPELPPTPAESPAAPREQSLILTFQQAVKVLKDLATKPAAKFIDACIPNDLQYFGLARSALRIHSCREQAPGRRRPPPSNLAASVSDSPRDFRHLAKSAPDIANCSSAIWRRGPPYGENGLSNDAPVREMSAILRVTSVSP